MSITLPLRPDDKAARRRLYWFSADMVRMMKRSAISQLIIMVLLLFLSREGGLVESLAPLFYALIAWMIVANVFLYRYLIQMMDKAQVVTARATSFELNDEGLTLKDEASGLLLFYHWANIARYDLSKRGLLIYNDGSGLLCMCAFAQLDAPQRDAAMAEMRTMLDAFIAQRVGTKLDCTEEACAHGELTDFDGDASLAAVMRLFGRGYFRHNASFMFLSAVVAAILLPCLGLGDAIYVSVVPPVFMLMGALRWWRTKLRLPAKSPSAIETAPLAGSAWIEGDLFCSYSTHGLYYRVPLAWLDGVLELEGSHFITALGGQPYFACQLDRLPEAMMKLPQSSIQFKPSAWQLVKLTALILLSAVVLSTISTVLVNVMARL